MQPTGRRFSAPTGELVEYVDDEHARYIAIVLHERYRGLESVRAALEYGRSFLDDPMVFGVCGLEEVDLQEGRFLYRTDEAWSLAELLAGARNAKRPLGVRAAAELAWYGGMVLAEAGESGEMQGVFCHFDVSPWRLLVRPEGDLMVIGYGLPEVEQLRMKRTGDHTPLGHVFSYAPPERSGGRPEDARSDLYSLALCVAEVVKGAPIYDGTPAERFLASRAGAARERVAAWKPGTAPKRVCELLFEMLAIDPNARPDLPTWCAAWEEVAGSASGEGLLTAAGTYAARAAGLSASKAAKPLRSVEPTSLHDLSELRKAGEQGTTRPARAGRATRGGGVRRKISKPTEVVTGGAVRPTAPKEHGPVKGPSRPRRPTNPEVGLGPRASASPGEPKRVPGAPSEPQRAEPPGKPKRAEPPAKPKQTTKAPEEPRRATKAPAGPERTAKAPTKPRRTTKAPAEPRRTTKATSEPKRTAKKPGAPAEPRRVPKKPEVPAEPKRVPKKPAEPRRASGESPEAPRAPKRPEKPKRVPNEPRRVAEEPRAPAPQSRPKRPSRPEEPTSARPRRADDKD